MGMFDGGGADAEFQFLIRYSKTGSLIIIYLVLPSFNSSLGILKLLYIVTVVLPLIGFNSSLGILKLFSHYNTLFLPTCVSIPH